MSRSFDAIVADPSPRLREVLLRFCEGHPKVRSAESASSAAFLARKAARRPPHFVVAHVAFLRGLPAPGSGRRIALCGSSAAASPDIARHWVKPPHLDDPADLQRFRGELDVVVRRVITELERAPTAPPSARRLPRPISRRPAPASTRSRPAASAGSPLIAIGASTGGTVAIEQVLVSLRGDGPPIVLAQHIASGFSSPFARRLDSTCSIRVVEADHGMPIARSHAYLAPADRHLAVGLAKGKYRCLLSSDERVNRHRPSVDYLFSSVARIVNGAGVGVLLTGMGRDGAEGLLAMRKQGARTLAQDEATSVVWGMPGAAREIGAVDQVHSLQRIAEELARLYRGE